MSTTTDVAIIGAGPYGLSLAAHLAAANVSVRVFGQPMQFWRTNMLEGMVLKSEGFASNLWHPDGALTLRDFCADRGLPYKDSGLPIPVDTFCAYGEAFQKRFVPMLDERPVAKLDRDPDGYLLRLRDGTTVTANRVVIATGIGSFPFTPPELAPIAGSLCSHSIEHHSLDRFTGQDVLIIGGGASGVELAGLMSAKGSHVTVVTRPHPILQSASAAQPVGKNQRARDRARHELALRGVRHGADAILPAAAGFPSHGGPQASRTRPGMDIARGSGAERDCEVWSKPCPLQRPRRPG
jgi:cation diffusion facilitator CzcD-associated flavoprotein CzcO